MLSDSLTVGVLFFVGLLALLAAGFTILRFALVEGTLDGAVALLLAGALLAGSAFAIKSQSAGWIALWIITVVAMTLGIPALASRGDKNALAQMQEEEIARLRRGLDNNPKNYLAWREIGEIYMKMNRYDDAIAAYKEAIKINPPDVQKIRKRLNAALEYKAGAPNASTLFCDECERETPIGKTCLHCGALLEPNLLQWLFQRNHAREILQPTLLITAGIFATLAVFSALPAEIKIVLVVACVIAGAFLVWRIVDDA